MILHTMFIAAAIASWVLFFYLVWQS